MKICFLIIGSIILLTSCDYITSDLFPDDYVSDYVHIAFRYNRNTSSVLGGNTNDHYITRFFCSDSNLPAELQYMYYYITYPGQYYLEYTTNYNDTWYMIYEIVTVNNFKGSRLEFELCLYNNGPYINYPYGYDNEPESEVWQLPTSSLSQQFLTDNHGLIINSSTQKQEGGYITIWYGKIKNY